MNASKSEILNRRSYSLEKNLNISELVKNYYLNIDNRTANLFSAICQIGSIINGGNEKHNELFREFGLYLGRSFQIVDDILDFIGDEKRLGKSTGLDLRNGLISLPMIFALKSLPKGNSLFKIMKNRDNRSIHFQEGIELVKNSDGINQAYSEARKWNDKAKKLLDLFPNNKYRRALENLADYIIQRGE